MPNTTYDFATVAGQTIAFDAATDVLSFGAAFTAANMTLVQNGSGASATVTVTIGGLSVTLQGMTLDKFRVAALAFANGSTAQIGDGLATTSLDGSANTINTGAGNDYIDGQGGNDIVNSGAGNDMIVTGSGTDTVNAGENDDTIVMGNELSSVDRIDGGAGVDTVRISGSSYANLTLVDGTLRNVENLVLEGDGNAALSRTYKIATHDATLTDGQTLTVDATDLDGADRLEFDGSAEGSASYVLKGGAGNDALKGGAGDDVIQGGDGIDTITGGQGADVLTGGAGDDLFVIARGTSKSDSSPTSIDRITDFQGAGAIGGDRISLPVPNGGKPLAFVGYKAFVLGSGEQAPNKNDGFADVFYDHFNGQTRIVIDVNDDGLISEVDQVIYLDGIHNLQAEDFEANFSIVRGTENADNILGSASGETINLLGGNDVADGRAGGDTIHGGAGEDEIRGGVGNDTLNGDADNDELHGGDDTDTLNGGEGNDALFGDAGGDTINGGNGNDTADGGIGGDTIKGDAGEDVLRGGADNDSINGGNDADDLFGDAGNDTLYGDAGNDDLDGGADHDKVYGGQGSDVVRGGDGNDEIRGDESNGSADGAVDYLHGDAGDDTLYAGTGRDILTGGTGADRFVVSNATSSAANPNRITDFNAAEGDKLQLSISGTKPLTWYGQKDFFFDGTFGNGGVQFPLANDGLADAIWDYDSATNTTRVAVDVDDDGVFSTGDLLIYLDGQHNLSASTFADTFAVVRGGAGADIMPGTSGVDIYYGMGGDDTLTGEGGNDTMYGGEGHDTIDGGEGGDTLNGDEGNDTITGGAGNFNDTITGGAGEDEIWGGDGSDSLNGGADNDIVRGEAGSDTIQGGDGADQLFGGDGTDTIYGGNHNDTIDGGADNDTLLGGDGEDSIVGGIGNDTIYGDEGNDTLNGGDGNDTLYGNAGADIMNGGAGQDTVWIGAADTLTGGAEADKFNAYYNSNVSTLTAMARVTDFQQGVDKLDISGINGTGITFVFNNGDRNLGALSTTAGSQTILGNGGDGLADVLYTTSGSTTYLIVDVNDDGRLDASDVVIAFDGDVDFTTADFTAGMYKVFRGSDGADVITGSDAVDTVYGVGGNDTINGMGGEDVLYGQDGDDTIDGGQAKDTIDGGAGNDTIFGGDGNFADTLAGGAGNDEIHGGDGNDSINGNADNDTLFGELGDDTVDGGAGDDVIEGGDGDDTLRGGNDQDIVRGGIGKDSIDGGEGNDILHGEDNDDTLTGGGGTDELYGGEGNDTLTGGGGADRIQGGAGDDTIRYNNGDTVVGGIGADTFRSYYNSEQSSLANQARITDFQQGVDKLEFTGINGMTVRFVFNSGDRSFGTLSTLPATQTILGNGGDGLADIFYSTSADGLTTHLIIDVNDDGKLDASDVVVAFSGDIDFNVADFVAGTFTVLRGSDGADFITGSTAADTIYGVGGNDTIDGSDGNDTLYGQDGDDTIQGGTGQDTIEGGAGDDTLLGGPGNFADTIYGGEGNDEIEGGDANDQLRGDGGNDLIDGGLGDDTIYGGTGDDEIDGGEGNDLLRGGADIDVMRGGLGDDDLDGDDGNDRLYGGDNNDNLEGGAGEDLLFGENGNDILTGNAGVDTIDGGAGDDTITFGRGDLVTGGAGADKFRTYFNSDISTLGGVARITDFQQGVDKLEIDGINGNTRLFAVNPTKLTGTIALGSALPFGSDAFADIAYSHENGANGPVTRVYIDENDNGVLDATDVVFELAGHINLTADDFTAATFRAVRGTPGADTMTGTSAADAIYGVAGNDTIRGGAGGDTLAGQDGDDTLYGEADNDSLYGGEGQDTIFGGIGVDSLYGENGDDVLEGEEGGDTLHGGLGQDTLRGGFGDDTLNGNAGNDILEGGADSDTLNGGDGEDMLRGQDGADTLKGDAGNDTIEGGALADTITGGAGNDTIDGGTEIDTAVFSGNIANYEIIAENGGITVRDLRTGSTNDGTDFLTNVERLQFADGTVQGAFLTVSDGVIVEGENGEQMMAFTVSLIGAPGSQVTVNYATSNDTASAGSDYTATGGSLTFAPGQTSKIVYVPIKGDTVNEVDEVFNLNLTNATGASIADGTGKGTILNDDCVASVSDAQVTEGNNGTKNLTFTISLDKAAAGPVSVSWKSIGDTAIEGVDYVAGSGIAQFQAGQTSKTITISINGDLMPELDEGFWIQLLSATGAVIGDGRGRGTIVNDDTNTAPVAGDDAFDLPFGQATLELTAAQLLGNDTDVNGQTLSLVSVQNAVNGTVAIVNGKVVFTPAANFSGTASFTYTISDGAGGTDTATVTIEVEAGSIDQVFNSTAAHETFDGGDGNDTVSYANVDAAVTVSLATTEKQNTGGGGIDRLLGIENLTGSAYADRLAGNALANRLVGGAGTDSLFGNDGADLLEGGADNDVLDGGTGADTMNGGSGNDRYVVDDSDDVVVEAADGGTDMVSSYIDYALAANVENLTLLGTGNLNGTGNALANVLAGNAGHNQLDGGAGADTMKGGKGDDRYIVDNAGDLVLEADGEGSDTVFASVSFSLAGQYVEVLNLTGSAAINGVGNGLGNRIVGNGAANVLDGRDGNDRLDGGAGADRMIGGLGNDIFVVDNASDVVVENIDEGTDTIEASITYSLVGRYVEVLKLTGSANLNGTGNSQANTLIGNAGSNLLNGGAAADTMQGGLGDDRYIVDDVNDKVIEANGEGNDTVESSVTFSLAGQYVETLKLTGSAAINGTGNSLANTMTGNAAANQLSGGAGDDSLFGGLGADTLLGGAGADGFYFDTALGGGNVDRIADFVAADDTLYLDRSVFTGIAANGALSAASFHLGATALDAADRILYDKATGNIWYDADGNGGTAAVLFATVAANTNLTAADFFAVP